MTKYQYPVRLKLEDKNEERMCVLELMIETPFVLYEGLVITQDYKYGKSNFAIQKVMWDIDEKSFACEVADFPSENVIASVYETLKKDFVEQGWKQIKW